MNKDQGSSRKRQLVSAVSVLGVSLGVTLAAAPAMSAENAYLKLDTHQIKGETNQIKGESQQHKLDSQQHKLDSQQHKLDSQQHKLDNTDQKARVTFAKSSARAAEIAAARHCQSGIVKAAFVRAI